MITLTFSEIMPRYKNPPYFLFTGHSAALNENSLMALMTLTKATSQNASAIKQVPLRYICRSPHLFEMLKALFKSAYPALEMPNIEALLPREMNQRGLRRRQMKWRGELGQSD